MTYTHKGNTYTTIHTIATYHNTASNDAVGTIQRDLGISDVDDGLALLVSYNIAQVPSMPDFVFRTPVFLPSWVEMTPRTHAACRIVAKLVDVKSVTARLQPCDLPSNFGLSISKLYNKKQWTNVNSGRTVNLNLKQKLCRRGSRVFQWLTPCMQIMLASPSTLNQD